VSFRALLSFRDSFSGVVRRTHPAFFPFFFLAHLSSSPSSPLSAGARSETTLPISRSQPSMARSLGRLGPSTDFWRSCFENSLLSPRRRERTSFWPRSLTMFKGVGTGSCSEFSRALSGQKEVRRQLNSREEKKRLTGVTILPSFEQSTQPRTHKDMHSTMGGSQLS